VSNKIVALDHDTSLCSQDEWSTLTYELHPEYSSSKLPSWVQPQSFLEPQGSFDILMETSDLRVTLLHSSFDMTHAFIILLSGYKIIRQYGCVGDVLQ
jgi:hypothetical protein